MKTISVDLRRRIVETYDEGKWTQEEVAKRFRVSLGMVKKLVMQRRRTGQIEARHRFSGRKGKIAARARRATEGIGGEGAGPHFGRDQGTSWIGLHGRGDPLGVRPAGSDI